jgi:hypothetical protein
MSSLDGRSGSNTAAIPKEETQASVNGSFGWMTVARYAVKGSLGLSYKEEV